jgi:PEP-CTERM motif
MRKLGIAFSVALTLLLGAAGQASAAILWYNGDFNGNNGLTNERNTDVSQSYTYDNFVIGAGGATITSVFSNNLMNFVTTTADWEIRSGVSNGNGGTLIASGVGSLASQTPTGNTGFGFTEFTIQVDGLNVALAPGTYWLAVAPVDSGSGRSFVSTTSGANAVGSPPGNDDNSFLDSAFFGASFQPASDFVGAPADFSMGVLGNSGVAAVPEPATLTLLGVTLAGMAGYRLRRRKLAAA